MTDEFLPTGIDPETEPHPFLRRFKKSWIKRYRPTRMEERFEAVDLAFLLAALGREPEAEALLSHVTHGVAFDGNYNLWTPVGYSLVTLARFQRLRGDEDAHATTLAPLIEHSFRVPVEPGEAESKIAETPAELDKADADTPKWGCHAISRHLMGLVFLRETAIPGFDHAGTYPIEPLDDAIGACFDRLRRRLT